MIWAATGHRLNKLASYPECYEPRIFDELTNVVIKWMLERNSIDRMITGMAIGFDMAVAKACVELKIPFHAYIPFIGQESKWPKPTKEFYRHLLTLAERVVVVSPGGYSPQKMQTRNIRMMDDGEAIVALHNGSEGGTHNALAYASGLNKKVENIWSRWVNR